jgi:hypothetical protein
MDLRELTYALTRAKERMLYYMDVSDDKNLSKEQEFHRKLSVELEVRQFIAERIEATNQLSLF